VKGLCEGKEVYLDIDDFHIIDPYGRIVAVVYIPHNETHRVNLNQLLLKEGYAEAKEYHNEFNADVWIESPLEYVDMTPTPEPTLTPTPTLMPSPSPTVSPSFTPIHCFEFVFAIIGVLAATDLIKRRG